MKKATWSRDATADVMLWRKASMLSPAHVSVVNLVGNDMSVGSTSDINAAGRKSKRADRAATQAASVSRGPRARLKAAVSKMG
eukprot:3749695-Rhodomonas_salina.1